MSAAIAMPTTAMPEDSSTNPPASAPTAEATEVDEIGEAERSAALTRGGQVADRRCGAEVARRPAEADEEQADSDQTR